MSKHTVVSSADAPPAVGPYSHGINTGSFVFLAGQIPLVRDTGNFVEGAIKEQTEQCIEMAICSARDVSRRHGMRTLVQHTSADWSERVLALGQFHKQAQIGCGCGVR